MKNICTSWNCLTKFFARENTIAHGTNDGVFSHPQRWACCLNTFQCSTVIWGRWWSFDSFETTINQKKKQVFGSTGCLLPWLFGGFCKQNVTLWALSWQIYLNQYIYCWLSRSCGFWGPTGAVIIAMAHKVSTPFNQIALCMVTSSRILFCSRAQLVKYFKMV